MSFALGSDEEEYRSFIVEQYSLFAKPTTEMEKCIEKDDVDNFQICSETSSGNGLVRFFAIASRFKSRRCFEVIVHHIAYEYQVENLDKHKIASILLYYRYAEGMRILYTHVGIKSMRIFDIEDVFENKGFLHTEAADGVSAQANTILGIIAYGRLREDMQEMAEVALDLGAEITQDGKDVGSPVLNAVQSKNYRFLHVFVSIYEDAVLKECANLDELPDTPPSRPSSTLTIPNDATPYMSLSKLFEVGDLIPGDTVEAKINSTGQLANHFMIYMGNNKKGKILYDDAIVHKTGSTMFSSSCLSGSLSSLSSSGSNSAQDSDGYNGSIGMGRMTPYEEDRSYTSWRRTGIKKMKTRKASIDIIFDAIDAVGTCYYDLITSNCEHFAEDITYGVGESTQVQRATTYAAGVVFIIAAIVSVHRQLQKQQPQQRQQQQKRCRLVSDADCDADLPKKRSKS